MELQTFINSHNDYLSEFKKHKFKINSYKGLKIISYSYQNPPKYNDLSDHWKMYCRGVVINSDNKIICLPPIKSIELPDKNDIPESNNLEYEYLIDGTMINLFYYNNEWIISTRSEIGGYNKWNLKKSFRTMFDECSNIDYDLLDKNCSYSFVMRHIENRNVSPIKNNQLFLVEVYHYNNNDIQRLPKSKYLQNDYSINENVVLAISFNLSEIVINDINGDGIWNILDVVLVINFIFGENNLTADQIINADLNQDGIINILDVVQMVNIILSI